MIVALLSMLAVDCGTGGHVPVTLGTVIEIVANTSDVSVVANQAGEIQLPLSGVDCRKLGNVVRVEATEATAVLSIVVPTWMPLKVAGSGSVRVQGILASIDIESTLGDIWIRGGRDHIVARTVHGSVDVADARGEIDLQAQHRPVALARSSGNVRIVNVTGETTLTDVQSSRLEASAVTGEIRCRCIPGPSAQWELRTHTGAVRVVLADTVGAVVTLDAPPNASRVDFPGAKAQRLDQRQLVVVLGKGGARIRLSSFSGAAFVAVSKR